MRFKTSGYIQLCSHQAQILMCPSDVELGRVSESVKEVGKSDAHGNPRCLYQRKGNSHRDFFMDLLLMMYKIDPSGFSSTKLLAELTRDTEELYTTHFGERRIPHPHSVANASMGSQLAVTRREHFLAFALDGHRKLTISPRSDLVCI